MSATASEAPVSNGERQCVGVFYSYSPHFGQAAQAARKRFPNAEVVAFIPPSYPRSHLEFTADRVREILPEPGARISPRTFLKLAQDLRRERLEGLVVLFDTPRLQVLSWCSGAKGRYWYTLDGRWEVLYIHPVTGMLRTFLRGVQGRCRYAYIWVQVHFRRVRHADLGPYGTKTSTDGRSNGENP